MKMRSKFFEIALLDRESLMMKMRSKFFGIALSDRESLVMKMRSSSMESLF